jgi:uncharacterized protein YjbJ (UPF0337 family)
MLAAKGPASLSARAIADRRLHMGAEDKVGNKIDETVGKAKEKAGDATNDPDLTREGEADQAKANLKQAAEKVKDAIKK